MPARAPERDHQDHRGDQGDRGADPHQRPLVRPALGRAVAKQPQHEYLYWEFHEKGSKQAVRMGDWKAIRLEIGKPLELYDLKRDPGETHDVAAEHPEVIAKIEAYLKTARTDSPRWPLKTPEEAAKEKPSKEDVN